MVMLDYEGENQALLGDYISYKGDKLNERQWCSKQQVCLESERYS